MASRKEQKEKLRQERLERERAAAAAAARRRRLGYVVAAGSGGAVAVAVVAIAFASGGSTTASSGSWPSGSVPKRQETDLNAAATAAGCVLQNPPSEGRGHTTKHQTYKTAPPTSGPHYPIPAHDNAYTTSPKPYEALVHALEHGRVIYWYKPDAPARIRGDLHALYTEDKALVVLTPNARPMPS